MKKGRDKIHTLLYYNVFDIFRSRKAVSWVITRACIGGFFATLLRGVIMAFILQNVSKNRFDFFIVQLFSALANTITLLESAKC